MDGQVMGGGVLSVNTVVPGTGLQLGSGVGDYDEFAAYGRSEEHTSELQSRSDLVCRLLLERTNTPTAPYSQAVLADAPQVFLRLGDLASDSTDRVAFDSSGGCHNADRTTTRLNSSHDQISYADFCLNNTSTPLYGVPMVTQNGSN